MIAGGVVGKASRGDVVARRVEAQGAMPIRRGAAERPCARFVGEGRVSPVHVKSPDAIIIGGAGL